MTRGNSSTSRRHRRGHTGPPVDGPEFSAGEGKDVRALAPVSGTTLLGFGGLPLEEALEIPIDVLTPGEIRLKFRHQALDEAQLI